MRHQCEESAQCSRDLVHLLARTMTAHAATNDIRSAASVLFGFLPLRVVSEVLGLSLRTTMCAIEFETRNKLHTSALHDEDFDSPIIVTPHPSDDEIKVCICMLQRVCHLQQLFTGSGFGRQETSPDKTRISS
jgi:hypothetical protein